MKIFGAAFFSTIFLIITATRITAGTNEGRIKINMTAQRGTILGDRVLIKVVGKNPWQKAYSQGYQIERKPFYITVETGCYVLSMTWKYNESFQDVCVEDNGLTKLEARFDTDAKTIYIELAGPEAR